MEMLQLKVASGVAWLTMNRPKQRNALNRPLLEAMGEIIEELATRNEVRVLVLSGAGSAFSVGQDLEEINGLSTAHSSTPSMGEDSTMLAFHYEEQLVQYYHRVVKGMIRFPKPVIAAVNGVAAGAGMSLALLADIRIFSETARLVPAFFQIGLLPDTGILYTLPRLVGEGLARRILLTGESIDAGTARQWGIADVVARDPHFEQEVAEWARRLAQLPPLAVREMKRLIQQHATSSLEELLQEEGRVQALLATTEDHQEGLLAFREKRQPRFFGN